MLKITFPWENGKGKSMKSEIIEIRSNMYSDDEMSKMLKKLMSSQYVSLKHKDTATGCVLAGLRGVNFGYDALVIECLK